MQFGTKILQRKIKKRTTWLQKVQTLIQIDTIIRLKLQTQ